MWKRALNERKNTTTERFSFVVRSLHVRSKAIYCIRMKYLYRTWCTLRCYLANKTEHAIDLFNSIIATRLFIAFSLICSSRFFSYRENANKRKLMQFPHWWKSYKKFISTCLKHLTYVVFSFVRTCFIHHFNSTSFWFAAYH